MESIEYLSGLRVRPFWDGDINLYEDTERGSSLKYIKRRGVWYRFTTDTYVHRTRVDEQTHQLLELAVL